MALFFDSPGGDGDFMPTLDEIENYREKLKRYNEPSSPTKRVRQSNKKVEYDALGRNLNEQENRQAKIPWITVRYDHRGRLIIPDEKKKILRNMRLL